MSPALATLLDTGHVQTDDEWFEAIGRCAGLSDAAHKELHDAVAAGDLAQALRACNRLQACGLLMGHLARSASRANVIF